MFYSRRINSTTGKVEVWECEWSNKGTGMAKKEYLRKVGNEDEIEFKHDNYSVADAICWAPDRTIGNIAVSSEEAFGMFEGDSGNDAILPCQIIPCGKFRSGGKRWYCKTHQIHWGTKADFLTSGESGEVTCSNHLTKMNYVVNPLEVEFVDFEEIGIWSCLPPALSSERIEPSPPKIHVHKRISGKKKKVIDDNFDAIVCSYNQNLGLFPNTEITKIQVTPPAAFEFVRSIETNFEMSCISCKKCGYPHLDLRSFSENTHKKHFCGNCGNDSIWSPEPIASTPLKPLHDQFSNSNTYIDPERSINLDDYKDYKFELWASTPAVVWTADRPQEKGIHVHIYKDDLEGPRIKDDTYSSVILNGVELDRKELWERMVQNTVLS